MVDRSGRSRALLQRRIYAVHVLNSIRCSCFERQTVSHSQREKEEFVSFFITLATRRPQERGLRLGCCALPNGNFRPATRELSETNVSSMDWVVGRRPGTQTLVH